MAQAGSIIQGVTRNPIADPGLLESMLVQDFNCWLRCFWQHALQLNPSCLFNCAVIAACDFWHSLSS